ncbi:MAG TPA: IPT/TIG domain-containing protein [Terriglobales bacterium]
MRRTLSLLAILIAFPVHAIAGGPRYVAGSTYFDAGTMGTPLTWSQGNIHYYTDQGNLSPILPGSGADAFVASAFSLWTSIPTAAVSANRGGQLAEDVNGSNVTVVSGSLSMPSDIQPSAVNTPIGIVYDADGAVTDALLGSGAGDSAYCAQNAAFGGIDNFGTDAHFQHALIILNGNCAATSAQLPDLQYHLARVLGRVLGLDWSQANLNVITRDPPPSAADFAGFPLMHEADLPGCIPVAACYSNGGLVNPAQPKLDDQAALSRLYPVTAVNLANFPGKQLFAETTARIRGTVYFNDWYGNPSLPMQGVNVVARLVDPYSGLVSHSSVVTSISGFLFCGNAGNIVTGYSDSSGQNFNRFGSSETGYEGLFDLAGLPVPDGNSATYELSVEALDPLWSAGVGPYGTTVQVNPSGIAIPFNVAVSPGSDSLKDIVMLGSAAPAQWWYQPTTYATPGFIPASGNWTGALSPYGTTDFFEFPAQANRTLSVIVNAVDEFGAPSQNKLLPVIGMWALANPGQSPAPAYTPTPFNTVYFGESRLDAQVLQSTTFRLGIADFRGDGRPDYRYNARLLYGDQINPARASVAGGTPLTIAGLGLQSNTSVHVAKLALSALAYSATQLLVNTPPALDGIYDVQLSDSATGANSTMSAVLTLGAGPQDSLRLISGNNSAAPAGGQAASPFSVMVVAPDGLTPVAGASLQFSSSPAVAFSACSGAATCTVLSDQSGMASTYMTVLSAGTFTLTAKLAPASYANPQQVQATLLGTSSSLDLSLVTRRFGSRRAPVLALP